MSGIVIVQAVASLPVGCSSRRFTSVTCLDGVTLGCIVGLADGCVEGIDLGFELGCELGFVVG